MKRPWERAAARVGGPAVVDGLAALSASDLTALLLEVSDRRQAAIRPADVLRRFGEDPFVAPSSVDQRTFTALDHHLLSRVPAAFQAVELGPVAPLGTCTAMGFVHPNNVLPTFRGTEVVADCTNVLALVCARRRGHGDDVVRLCTSHRVVRTARVSGPGLTQHFRMLTLVTAGRDPGGRRFESQALAEQLDVWLGLLGDLPDPLRAEVIGLRLAWTPPFADVVEGLRSRLSVPIVQDPDRLARSAYYQGLAFKLEVRAPDGTVYLLGDGGFVDWVGRLRQDRKERLLISAVGTELLVKGFRRS